MLKSARVFGKFIIKDHVVQGSVVIFRLSENNFLAQPSQFN